MNAAREEYFPSSGSIHPGTAPAALRKARRKKASSPSRRMDCDRLPPHSLEAEQGVLGCVLLSPNECINECIEKFGKRSAQVFYDLRHQALWFALLEMHEKNVPVDLITFQQHLKNQGELESVGGLAYISTLPDAVPSAANLGHYIDIVLEKFVLRKMVHTCADIVARIYDNEGEVDVLLDGIEADLSALTEREGEKSEHHIKEVMQMVISDMEQWHYMRGKLQLRGLPTGPPGSYLDKILLGIRDTHFVVIAGRPGDGKSSKAMNIVEFLAKDYVWHEPTGEKRFDEGKKCDVPVTVERKGIPVGVFTIEMDNESLGYRLLFGRAEVDEAEWNQGFSRGGDMEKLIRAAGQLSAMNIILDDTPGQTINQIAAKARRWAKQYGIKLFVLDYLQLVESDGGNGFDRVKELTKISRKIMALKKQLKVPWLVLCQMNRNIETSETKRDPVMSDLKDCGAIEQDADKIIFLYRPDKKQLEKRPDEDRLSDKEILEKITDGWHWSKKPYRMNMLVAKNRRGPKGKAEEVFCPNLCRFEDWHLFKVKHNAENLKEGETRRGLGLPSNAEMNLPERGEA